MSMTTKEIKTLMDSSFRHTPEGKLVMAVIIQAWDETGSKDPSKRKAAQMFFKSEDFKEYLRLFENESGA